MNAFNVIQNVFPPTGQLPTQCALKLASVGSRSHLNSILLEVSWNLGGYLCQWIKNIKVYFKVTMDCGHKNICTTTLIYASSVYVYTGPCELEMWNCKLHNCKRKHLESAWTPHGFLCYFLRCGKNCYRSCRCIFQWEDPSQHIPAVVLDQLMWHLHKETSNYFPTNKTTWMTNCFPQMQYIYLIYFNWSWWY